MLVLITGCTRGLGLAMTRGFAAAGWTVAGCGRNETAIAALRRELPAHHFTVCDTTDTAAVERFAADVLRQCGAPDLLLNNAATISPNAPLWETTPEDFASVMRVNLCGVHHMIRAFVPAMIAAGRGVIVNFSSGWGRSTSPEVAPYCASKWGIEGLSQAMAQELPRGMACVALNPGIIDTDMLRSCFGGSASDYPAPAEWARQAVPFLAALGPKDNGMALTVPY